MGKLVENEVTLRELAKEVRTLIIEKGEIEKSIAIIKEHEDILTVNFGRSKYLSLLPTIRSEKGLKNKYRYLEKLIQTGTEIYVKNENYEELAFFAAACCDVENLHVSMKNISEECRSKTREGDTVLLFFVKFANLENAKYTETLEILVNDYKLSVNQVDYRDHSPIIILLNKYASLQEKGIETFNNVIINAIDIILNRGTVDLWSHKLNGKNALDFINLNGLTGVLHNLNKNTNKTKNDGEDKKNILFALLAQKNEKEFLKTIKEMSNEIENIFDVDDGNNTLLQLACEKNLETVVAYLVQQGADLSKTTNRNKKTPVEIAARRNFYSIFKTLLNENKLVIDASLFTIFLLNRCRQIKSKYFDEILCYDGLQMDIVYGNGNTPLHYAIIFGNTEAILKLLKRGASLLVKNNYGKAPLDYISKEELELYLDQCLLLDNYNKPHSKKYELRFDFNGLLQTNTECSEVEVISKICTSEKLRSLATHPLLLAFMEAKWNLVSPVYNKILMVYGYFFIYYFILSIYIGHVTFLFFLTFSLLIFVTLQPSVSQRTRESYLSILFYVVFTFLVYGFIKNKQISTCILTVTLLYQFLKQHLYFSKYQALAVHGIRKITPHVIALFGLYCLSDMDTFFKNSKIIFPITIYLLVVTHSFNALVDSVSDIEHSFKTLYNKNTLDFIKFAEKLYFRFSTIFSSPFIKHNLECISSPKKKKSSTGKFYLNYFLYRNKFVNDKFHFLKLDVVTVKSLQDYVVRKSVKTKKETCVQATEFSNL